MSLDSIPNERMDNRLQHSSKIHLLNEFSSGKKLFILGRPANISDSDIGNYYEVVLAIGEHQMTFVDGVMHVPKPQRTIDGERWMLDVFLFVDGPKLSSADISLLKDIQVGARLTQQQIENLSEQLR